jgi:hypothetical protein
MMKALKTELEGFLHGEHDDIIDTLSVAFMNMTRSAAAQDKYVPKPPRSFTRRHRSQSRVLVCPDE